MTMALRFEERVYKISPKMSLICAIEDELGSIPALIGKFNRDDWLMSDLVSLTHIMLQQAGRSIDFMTLGDTMLHEGIGHYLAAIVPFLTSLLPKELT